MFLFRDRFGIKPLYILESNSGIIFGSEPKSFIQLVGSLELNVDSISKYVTFLWCPGERKIAKNLQLISPGTKAIINEKRNLDKSLWYDVKSTFKAKKISGSKIFFKETKKILRSAVHKQMISDAPLGAFLSGGLDSSSVVAFAKEINPNIECFTINQIGGVDHGETNDLEYAKQAADFLKVNLNILDISQDDLIENIESMIWMLDEPLADPASLNVHFISQFARKKRVLKFCFLVPEAMIFLQAIGDIKP